MINVKVESKRAIIQYWPQIITATNHDYDGHSVYNKGHFVAVIVLAVIFVAFVVVSIIVKVCGRLTVIFVAIIAVAIIIHRLAVIFEATCKKRLKKVKVN